MLKLGLATLARWEDIAQVRGVAQSVRPKGCADGLGPLLPCVQELLASALREVPDGLLGNAILEVRIYPANGELFGLGTRMLDGRGCRQIARCHSGSGQHERHAQRQSARTLAWRRRSLCQSDCLSSDRQT